MKLSPQQQRGDRTAALSPECIAAEIEQAWLALASKRRPVDVYVTRRGRVIWPREIQGQTTAELVGRYDSSVTLQHFREDVFHVWEELQR